MNDVTQSDTRNKKIPIAEAWALVAYADRINHGEYIKFPEFDSETGNVKRKPNRELINDQVDVMGFRSVTAEDRAQGERFAEHFQGLVFDALSGKMIEVRMVGGEFLLMTEENTQSECAA